MTRYATAFDWARRQVDSGLLPTAVLGIATSEGVVALDAFGASGDRQAKIDDYYPLFSITKPIVGLTALRAVENGLLSLTAPLSSALPEFVRGDVTLTHLLTHTSGIAEPSLDAPQGLRRALLEGGADFAAGSMSRYSSVAFDGVKALVESATGDTLESALAAMLGPIGAGGITFDIDVDPHPVVDAAQQGLDYNAFVKLNHPGAGLLARASDLLALGSALLREDGSVVHRSTQAAMLRHHTVGLPKLEPYPAERGQDWGLGWNVRHSAPGLLERNVFGHGGWAGTEFWIYPELGVCFVLLTNIASPSRFGLETDQLFNAVAAAT
ncbi:MAG: hypothetical protein JWQ43_3777 [Glaciihabitans sp.]|nr:hypothetical protein [Glaciihabitans sp.]